jgi:hypothetical protein
MEAFTRHCFEQSFKLAFLEKTGDEFQDFFSSIMEKRHPADFIRVRPWGKIGDRKNDGYLRSKRILFQCYAPDKIKPSVCIAKIEEDFDGALPHWEQYFDTWVFVHNAKSGLGPQVTAKLLDLDKQHETITVTQWGREELRQEVFCLAEADLTALLGAVPSRQTMIELGLVDLAPVLDQIARLPPSDKPDLRPVPAEKLAHNMLSDGVATLLRAGMSRAPLVRQYCERDPQLLDRLATSFQAEYERLRLMQLPPDDIFTELQRFAGGTQVSAAMRQTAVLACLAFFFEECDIFDRPEPADPGDPP